MSKRKPKIVVSAILLTVSIVMGLSISSSAYSVMTYRFKSPEDRQIDWQIAQLLEYGSPQHNNYYYGDIINGQKLGEGSSGSMTTVSIIANGDAMELHNSVYNYGYGWIGY
ncbi:MAG: hypothetical protein ACOYCE_03115 [Limnochordia bacterium]|jgi:hypothetical protein|nr:hypothetical protein [Bacillota bacterium]